MRRKIAKQRIINGKGESVSSVIYLLAFCFLGGSLAGCMVGFLSTPGEGLGALGAYADQGEGFSSFILSLWACSKYHLLALLLAGTVFGVLALPLLSVFRGYLLGCAASALTAMDGGLFLSLVVIGLPSSFFSAGLLSFMRRTEWPFRDISCCGALAGLSLCDVCRWQITWSSPQCSLPSPR